MQQTIRKPEGINFKAVSLLEKRSVADKGFQNQCGQRCNCVHRWNHFQHHYGMSGLFRDTQLKVCAENVLELFESVMHSVTVLKVAHLYSQLNTKHARQPLSAMDSFVV